MGSRAGKEAGDQAGRVVAQGEVADPANPKAGAAEQFHQCPRREVVNMAGTVQPVPPGAQERRLDAVAVGNLDRQPATFGQEPTNSPQVVQGPGQMLQT